MNSVRYGWKCPECGTIHAPFIPECQCTKKKAQHEQKSHPIGKENPLPDGPDVLSVLHDEVGVSLNEDINVSWLDTEGNRG